MAGRPNKYNDVVKPRLPEVREWLEAGATEKEVCDNLGISEPTWCGYKKEHPELFNLVKDAKRKPVQQIKAALFKLATGFHYTETVTSMTDKGTQITTYNKYSPPNTTAALILLKHWDKEDDGSVKWTSDPATYDLKCKEYELKKEIAERDGF